MSELAEKLRDWMEARIKARSAYEALIEMDADAEYFTDDTARAYLRGYDDATDEMDPYIEKLERRVEELEAFIAAQDAHDHSVERDEVKALRARVAELEAAQPAAVGVMGYGITDGRLIGPWIEHTRERAEQRLRVSSSYTNVVAILNADIIAQPAQEREG